MAAKKYNTTEELVKDKLGKLIKEVAKEIYTDDFKKGTSYLTPENNLDTLGIIVAKYCQWDGDAIKDVAMSAFEDANFSGAVVELDGE